MITNGTVYISFKKIIIKYIICFYSAWTIKNCSAKELMLSNCGVGEDSSEFLGLQGDATSPS